MKRIVSWLALSTLGAVLAFAAFPRILSTDPAATEPGSEVVAEGQNLDSSNVVKLFLTANGKDTPVEIKEQTAEAIRFLVPQDIDVGQYVLTVQTGGPTPTLMEQPVRLEVADAETLAKRAEESKERSEVPQSESAPSQTDEPQAQAESGPK